MMWIAVLAVAAGSFAFRLSVLVVPNSILPAGWDRALQAVAPAVIASLVVAELVSGVGAETGLVDVAAAIAAVVVARWRDSLMAAAYVGMAILWIPLLAGG